MVLLCAVVWFGWRREFISGVFQVLHFQEFLKRYVLDCTRGDIYRVCGDEDFPSRVVQCAEQRHFTFICTVLCNGVGYLDEVFFFELKTISNVKKSFQ